MRHRSTCLLVGLALASSACTSINRGVEVTDTSGWFSLSAQYVDPEIDDVGFSEEIGGAFGMGRWLLGNETLKLGTDFDVASSFEDHVEGAASTSNLKAGVGLRLAYFGSSVVQPYIRVGVLYQRVEAGDEDLSSFGQSFGAGLDFPINDQIWIGPTIDFNTVEFDRDDAADLEVEELVPGIRLSFRF